MAVKSNMTAREWSCGNGQTVRRMGRMGTCWRGIWMLFTSDSIVGSSRSRGTRVKCAGGALGLAQKLLCAQQPIAANVALAKSLCTCQCSSSSLGVPSEGGVSKQGQFSSRQLPADPKGCSFVGVLCLACCVWHSAAQCATACCLQCRRAPGDLL